MENILRGVKAVVPALGSAFISYPLLTQYYQSQMCQAPEGTTAACNGDIYRTLGVGAGVFFTWLISYALQDSGREN